MNSAHLLVVDDDPLVCSSLKLLASQEGYKAEAAGDGDEAVRRIKDSFFDIVLADVRMPRLNGIRLLETVKEMSPGTEVVMITAYGSIEDAVKAMKLGAYDYLVKPYSADEMKLLLKRLTQRQKPIREQAPPQMLGARRKFWNIVGRNPQMQAVFDLIETVANRDCTVLIYGETGTGKELVARSIHFKSHRKNQPFVKIDCATLPGGLLESELFGHEKGAFTDAIKTRKGRFERAHGGTVFLDEIANISLDTQAKLLRVVEERNFEMVGGNKTIEVDVRIIAATNRNLQQAVKQGSFRDDLYYRLKVVSIHLPPLREKKDDIPLLAKYFLEQANKENKKNITSISPEAMELLMTYNWPGNVRELENTIRQAVVLTEGTIILPDTLNRALHINHPTIVDTLRQFHKGITGGDLSYHGQRRKILELFDKEIITSALFQSGGNVTRAAQYARMNRTSFQKLMKKYGVERTAY